MNRAHNAVRLSTMPLGRAMSLVRHRKRRIRNKWETVLIMDRRYVESAPMSDVLQTLREAATFGTHFTRKGYRALVRALKKCGHQARVA
jgi:hypothetical protein